MFMPMFKRFYTSASSDSLFKSRISKAISENKVLIFMKGTPNAPQCGFSKAACQILSQYLSNETAQASFASVNCLESEELRQAIKEHSKWPTFPQIYIKGELIGGYDILNELHKSGKLEEMLDTSTASKEN